MPIFGYGATMALFAYIYNFIAVKPKSDDIAQTKNCTQAAAQNTPAQTPPAQAPQHNTYANVPQSQFEEIGDDDELLF